MRLLKEDALCLVIDCQEKLMPAMNKREELTKNIRILIEGLRAMEVPLIVTQQYSKGLGGTVEEIQNALGEYTPYDKITFSCYENDEIRKAIEATGKKTIILCGTEAHVCVLQTLIDLRAAGYTVVYVWDCVGSRHKEDKKLALARAQYEQAIPATYENLLFELCRRANLPYFKTISNIVK